MLATLGLSFLNDLPLHPARLMRLGRRVSIEARLALVLSAAIAASLYAELSGTLTPGAH